MGSCTSKLWVEGGFFSKSKTKCGDLPQTSSVAFLVDFSGIVQLKNTKAGLLGLQEMRISLIGKWVWSVLMWTKMKSSPETFLEEFLKNNMIERL